MTVSDGAGFDLTDAGSIYQPSNGVALVASSGKIKLKTGTRPLVKGDYLVKWAVGNKPNCRFVLESDVPEYAHLRSVKVADGVRISSTMFMILVR